MKKQIYIFLAAAFVGCNEKEGKVFEVEGTLKNSAARMVYLEEVPFTGANPIIIDSAELLKNGSFELQANSDDEGLYSLRTENKVFPFALVINDAPRVTVTADANNQEEPYTVKGSPATEALIKFDKSLNDRAISIFRIGSQMDSLSKLNASDSIKNVQYAKVEAAVGDLKKFALDFFKSSNHPLLVMYGLGSYQNMAANLGIKKLTELEIGEILNTATAKFPNNKALEHAKKQLRPSQVADITLPDVNGNQVSLSSFKGKYLLVDFWASWCQPCRRENPNIVKAYNQFKNKNFTILGVSLDQNKEAWVKAIQNDGLTWNHVSDLKFWESKAVETYKFNSIPYNFLLDPQGNIIAEDLHGEELIQTLSKYLK